MDMHVRSDTHTRARPDKKKNRKHTRPEDCTNAPFIISKTSFLGVPETTATTTYINAAGEDGERMRWKLVALHIDASIPSSNHVIAYMSGTRKRKGENT